MDGAVLIAPLSGACRNLVIDAPNKTLPPILKYELLTFQSKSG